MRTIHQNSYKIRLHLTWLGCKALGPLTFLDFSNCGETLVMWPIAPINDNLCNTCEKRNFIRGLYHVLDKSKFLSKSRWLCHSEYQEKKYLKGRQYTTCVIPFLSILNLLISKLPVERVLSRPRVMIFWVRLRSYEHFQRKNVNRKSGMLRSDWKEQSNEQQFLTNMIKWKSSPLMDFTLITHE